MTLPDLLKPLFIILILAGAGYYFLNYEGPARQATVQSVPCLEPLTYRIGEIDSRFGISESEVAAAMKQAASIWSEELSRPAAIESDEGNVVVKFVYDERQQVVDGEVRFRQRIESEQIRLDQFLRTYERKRREFEERSERYSRLANETLREIGELNRWVEQRSPAGGLSEQDAGRFEDRKRELERKQQEVQREKENLESLAQELNRDADRLNLMTAENNRLVDEYNNRYSGEKKFTKATYQNLPDGGAITVNTYLTKSELVLILAHELGHAFGLDHLPNSKSVMHSQMGDQELFPILQLTGEDKAAIRGVCAGAGI
ncbi:matrixin family metalloprotease [Rhodohalobacter mucosus]|uniref:Peptidase M10 metallopeptidase domain-containing protein n=1 Tax=Rhodohalobacter mucosus TaxID=2079485 RepID=A0A316TWX6_9BACT|nr:matrixin family metalloprotease [Rhodohalobacter mucosus]PWN07909.1 hypothetical protein DDZ15_02550 [Rhodohalobacter mucosus]